MKIRFKLFAALRIYLERDGGKQVDLTVGEGTTPMDLLGRYGVPLDDVHMVLINGHHLPLEHLTSHPLVDGDVVAVWPPVAGG